jgi:hypothetical protein
MTARSRNQSWHDFAHTVDVLIASAFAEVPPLKRVSENPDDEAAPRAPPRPPRPANDDVVFLFEAAATGEIAQAIVSHSECGLWTLEIFVGTSSGDRAEQRGSLLLTTRGQNRAAYEGCAASIYVGVGEFLAAGVIVNSELFSEISLKGLDLQKTGKIWVRFASRAFPPGTHLEV